MKKGDHVKNELGWVGVVIGFGKNVRLLWQSGPRKGKEANLPKQLLRRSSAPPTVRRKIRIRRNPEAEATRLTLRPVVAGTGT